MANKTFNARLKLKYDSYTNWSTKNPVLLAGELAICVVPADSNQATNEPTVLMKCGDGTKTFNELGWISGLSADVYGWAKAANKPTYSANEITGLSDYISGEIQDTDTQYELRADADNGRKFYLYSKAKGDEAFGTSPVSTIEIPETVYTLATGTANGTVKFNGEDVAVKGLGSAAYTDSDAYDAKGDAQTAEDNAKVYADGKDSAIAAAKKAGTDAQAAVDALSGKVGTVPENKTVVEMIADAQTAATYDDAAVKADIKANADAITKLNGTSAVEGSVDKKVADAINEFATKVSDDQTVNTFKELIDYAAEHKDEYSTLSGEVQKNTTAIATLNGTGAGSVTKTVNDAVEAAQATLQANIDKKVDAETGKGLSTNDYTNDDQTKLAGIAAGAQVNVIESVKVNGVALDISDKAVDVTVPTGALANKNTVSKTELAEALKNEIEGKVNSADCGNIISHDVAEFAAADHNHDTVYSKLDHNHKIEELEQTDYIVFDCGTASTII